MDLSFTSWNIRGLNRLIARKNLKKLILESKADVVIIQETKCSTWSDQITDTIWDSNHISWEAVNSTGSSGGLLCIWNKKVVNFSITKSSMFWMWCKGAASEVSNFNLVNIYGPHRLEEKYQF